MNKKLIDWWIGGGSQYTSEYQAVLDRATALGYTQPSAAQKVKQNTFLEALKTNGIWNSLDFLYVYCTDASLQFARLNWKAPSSFEGGGGAFSSNVGLVASSQITTTYTPSTGPNWTLNDASHFFVQDNSGTGTVNIMVGGSITNYYAVIFPSGSYFHGWTINDGTQRNANFGAIASHSNRLTHVQRTASNVSKIFKDGVQVGGNSAQASVAVPTAALTLALNANATYKLHGGGASLTGKEATLNTLWNNYFGSL